MLSRLLFDSQRIGVALLGAAALVLSGSFVACGGDSTSGGGGTNPGGGGSGIGGTTSNTSNNGGGGKGGGGSSSTGNPVSSSSTSSSSGSGTSSSSSGSAAGGGGASSSSSSHASSSNASSGSAGGAGGAGGAPASLPPDPVTALTVLEPTQASVKLQFTAGLGAGGVGVADHFAAGYVVAASCSGVTSLTGTTPISGFPVPGAVGTIEDVLVGGLAAGTSYCFAVEAADADGTPSTIATVVGSTGVASSSGQIAAVRAAIAAGTAATTTLDSLPIDGATVSYVKTAVGSAPDGNGFFLQTDPGGPAIYVAIDPATLFGALSPALAPGDVVSIVPTTGAWLDCSSPCSASNSLYAVTVATGTRDAVAGAIVPAADSLATTDVVIPAAPNWPLDEVLVSGPVALTGPFVNAGTGYLEAPATTGADPTATTITLRMPTTLIASTGATNGCAIVINKTPLWRENLRTEISAWQAADLSIVSCPALTLTSSSPASGASAARLTPTLALSFSAPVDLTTLVPSTAGACGTATVQLTTAADPSTCVALPSFTGDATQMNFNASAAVSPALAPNTNYVLHLTAGLKSTNGQAIAPTNIAFTTAANDLGCSEVLISQVYGGGGNSSATYTNDFIELHNPSSTDSASLSGCSVQYTSSSGTGAWQTTVLPDATIRPGGYYLIQEASSAAVGVALPAPDFAPTTGAINMSGTAGTVALSSVASAFPSAACPSSTPLVDLVGFGTGACKEVADAPNPNSNAKSLARASGGCTDAGNNSTDFAINTFATGVPPRNVSTTAFTCP